MAATLSPTIDKAARIVRLYSADEVFRQQAESRDKWQRDVATLQAEGYAKGLAEGHAEGLAEGHAEGHAEGVAEERLTGIRRGLAQGFDPKILASIFQISEDEVHRLAATDRAS